MARRERVAALVLALPGVVAPFLSFTYHISPLKTIVEFGSGRLWVLGAPFFLAMPIAAWQVRRCAVGRLSPIEIALAYFFATAAMLPVLVGTAIALSDSELPPLVLVVLAGLGGVVGANVLLLVRNLVRRVPNQVTAEVFLLGGYMPNAVLCLLGLAHDWNVGAYVVLIACIAYLLTIILRLRGEAS